MKRCTLGLALLTLVLATGHWPLATAVGSWTPRSTLLHAYHPTAQDGWNYDKAAHLMRRAGFGADSVMIERMVAEGYAAAAERIIQFNKVSNDSLEARLQQSGFDLGDRADIKAWWIVRMAETERPLEERMTLFWHNHFATSLRKVRLPETMVRQNELFRRLAMGDFLEMVLEVSKDPAMIQWLDNGQNRKGNPNENYARELMELFTTGIGHYTEQDIKEAARAFTGWQATFDGFFFNPQQHDFEEKTFMGQRGPWNGGDIIRILAGHPATARRLSERLFEHFAYPDPDDAIVEDLARLYTSSGRNIGAIVEAILRSKAFYSKQALQAQIKSPAEYVVQTAKMMQVPISRQTGRLLALASAQMGQDLFEPPTVKGWDGGPAWINTASLLSRHNFVERLSSLDGLPFWQRLRDRLERNLKGSSDAGKVIAILLSELVQGPVEEQVKANLVAQLSSIPSTEHPGSRDRKGAGSFEKISRIHNTVTLPPPVIEGEQMQPDMRRGEGARFDIERAFRRQLDAPMVTDWPAGLKAEQVRELVTLVLTLPVYQLN